MLKSVMDRRSAFFRTFFVQKKNRHKKCLTKNNSPEKNVRSTYVNSTQRKRDRAPPGVRDASESPFYPHGVGNSIESAWIIRRGL